MQLLNSFGLKLKASKLQICCTSVRCLGFDLAAGAYSLGSHMGDVAKTLPPIVSKRSLQHALGLLNLLRASSRQFATIVQPFYDCIRELPKGQKGWALVHDRFVEAMH